MTKKYCDKCGKEVDDFAGFSSLCQECYDIRFPPSKYDLWIRKAGTDIINRYFSEKKKRRQ